MPFGKIDRKALVMCNNPVLTEIDTLASLSVGNGAFAFTVDVTGLQTFPEFYSHGVPLGTQSYWGWHSFPNTNDYRPEEALESFDFGHGHTELYSVQPRMPRGKTTDIVAFTRRAAAVEYLRTNPHRLHLGTVGLELLHVDGAEARPEDIVDIRQQLNMWNGHIGSAFTLGGSPVTVNTACHPVADRIAARVESPLLKQGRAAVKLRFAYPTGQHSDDACNWNLPEAHQTVLLQQGSGYAVLQRSIDAAVYYVKIT